MLIARKQIFSMDVLIRSIKFDGFEFRSPDTWSLYSTNIPVELIQKLYSREITDRIYYRLEFKGPFSDRSFVREYFLCVAL